MVTLQEKFSNYLSNKSIKHSGEIILLNNSKILLKSSKKNFKKIIQISIINLVSVFKTNQCNFFLNIPIFIQNTTRRNLSAVKLLAKNSIKFKLFNNSSINKEFIEIKNIKQKSALKFKKLFLYYRWT